MIQRATLVWPNCNGITSTKSKVLDANDPENMTYSAALIAFVLTRKKDIKGGAIFLDDALTLDGAKAVVEAELAKVVYQKPAIEPTQIAAIQLLEQYGIETQLNPNIILAGEEIQ